MHNKLKKLRMKHELSQYKMSIILGISQSQYSKIERGIFLLTLPLIMSIYNEFGINIVDITIRKT